MSDIDAEVRAELERVLRSPHFDASDRNRRFLSYVCEETLAGRADRIKAYSVATDVFGRPDAFNAQIDPIVRIEARRLRQSLDQFYHAAGTGRVRIVIPKGGYAPIFERPEAEPVAAAAPERSALPVGPTEVASGGPSVFVFCFDEDDHAAPNRPRLGPGFTRRLVANLTRFSHLRVFGPIPEGGAAAPDRLVALGIDYLLSGDLSGSDGVAAVDAMLTEAATGRHVWAGRFERPVDGQSPAALRDALASEAARKIGNVYGPIFAAEIRKVEAKPIGAFTARDCEMLFYVYRRSFDPDRYELVRRGLERVVAEDPANGEALACLAMLVIDGARFRFGGRSGDVDLEAALNMARRAVDLAPFSSHSHLALGNALWFGGETQAAIAALEGGLSLNPNDTDLSADLGLRYAMQRNWDRAVPLLRKALDRNPELPGHHHIGLALHHFAEGRWQEALSEARQIGATGVVHSWAMRAACAARLGRADEARACVDRILELRPDYGAEVEGDLHARGLVAESVDELLSALRLAGLPDPSAPARVVGLDPRRSRIR